MENRRWSAGTWVDVTPGVQPHLLSVCCDKVCSKHRPKNMWDDHLVLNAGAGEVVVVALRVSEADEVDEENVLVEEAEEVQGPYTGVEDVGMHVQIAQ